LSLISRIRNVNGKPFSFSFAYHTYLSVSDIRSGIICPAHHYVYLLLISMSDMLRLVNSSEVRIEGLETLDYLDNLSHKERFTEQGDAITFESEVKFS